MVREPVVTADCYKFYAEHNFTHPLPQWLSDEQWTSLCNTLCHAALSALFHASADLKLLCAPHGLFNHQICGSTGLWEVQAAATWRLLWRRQVCANASSNSEELKLAETFCGSGMLAAELVPATCGSLLKLSAEYAAIQPILTFLFG